MQWSEMFGWLRNEFDLQIWLCAHFCPHQTWSIAYDSSVVRSPISVGKNTSQAFLVRVSVEVESWNFQRKLSLQRTRNLREAVLTFKGLSTSVTKQHTRSDKEMVLNVEITTKWDIPANLHSLHGWAVCLFTKLETLKSHARMEIFCFLQIAFEIFFCPTQNDRLTCSFCVAPVHFSRIASVVNRRFARRVGRV